jgi:release factor glutamine methyltransferase
MSNTSIQQALSQAQHTLSADSESPRIDSEALLAHVLECNRTYLRTWPEKSLSPEQQSQFQQLISRRHAGEPIAYIIGKREFWDMTLQVSPDALIPRPETEHLVELALEKIPPESRWMIADLGTGCGAIALAIARERPQCKIFATDKSAAALTLAQNNARHLGIKNVTFIEGDWFDPFSAQREGQGEEQQVEQQFEIIVSNPPYIHPDDQHLGQGDLRFEPTQALRSSPDGLADIQAIAEAAREYLVSPGWLILEHGYDQGSTVKETLETLGYTQVSTMEDLAKNERLSIGKWDMEME